MQLIQRNDVLSDGYCHQIIGLYSGFLERAAVGEGKRKTYRGGRNAMSHEMESSMQLNAYTTGLAKAAVGGDIGFPVTPMHCDLVMYGPGDGFSRHRDANKKEFTCIYFLNDGYEGGDLCFDNGEVFSGMPAGSAVCWKNTKDSSHWVTEVTKGQRYVLAHWLQAIK